MNDPAIAPKSQISPTGKAIYVVNEGIWGRDNASITRFDKENSIVTHNYFQAQNPGLRLGDTANDFFVKDSLIYIVMNGSNTIEIIKLEDFSWHGRVLLEGNPSPRSVFVDSDSLAFVTALYADELLVINPQKEKQIGAIPVGPAPEGVIGFGDYIFVANSGFGDIRGSESGAGTISAIDRKTLAERYRLPGLFNNQNLHIGADDLLYIGGTGSHVSVDTLSGILVIDPVRLTVLDTIPIANTPRDFALSTDGFGYVLTDSAVVKFSMQTHEVVDQHFFDANEISGAVYFYAIAIDATTGEIYVSNASNFSTNGGVFCLDSSGLVQFQFPTRINPGSIWIQ